MNSLIKKNLDQVNDFTIEHIDSETMDKILTMTPEERKAKKLNKSTSWYQKKIKEGKEIKVYSKTKVRIECIITS